MSSLFTKYARPSVEAEEKAKKESNLFPQIDNLWEKNTPPSTYKKYESVYMMNRFLSLTKTGFVAASDCNAIISLPEWAKYTLLYYTVPQGQKPFKKYPKMEKVKLPEKKQKALNRLCRKFCVKEFHGLQIMTILEQQGFVLEES